MLTLIRSYIPSLIYIRIIFIYLCYMRDILRVCMTHYVDHVYKLFNLIKIQLFIILSFYYRMKIWQRPIVGHVQMNFIVNQSNLSLPDSEMESSQSWLYGVFWLAGEIPWDGNNKGRLHMTSYGPLSDLHTIVER